MHVKCSSTSLLHNVLHGLRTHVDKAPEPKNNTHPPRGRTVTGHGPVPGLDLHTYAVDMN